MITHWILEIPYFYLEQHCSGDGNRTGMELRKKPKRQDDQEAEELKNQDGFETTEPIATGFNRMMGAPRNCRG